LVLRKLRYGELCQNAKDACTLGAECIDSVCKCGPGLALSTSGWCERFEFKSLPRAKPNESCEKGEMCTGGSICDNDSKTCICSAGHLIVNGLCRSKGAKAFLGAVPFSGPGESCVSGENCSGNSFCVSGTCQCDGEHYAEDGYCRHTGRLMIGILTHYSTKVICLYFTCFMSIWFYFSPFFLYLLYKCAPFFQKPLVLFQLHDPLRLSTLLVVGFVLAQKYSCHVHPLQCVTRPLVAYLIAFAPELVRRISNTRVVSYILVRFLGRRPPGGLSPSDIPQFVVLTFDDAVNGRTFPDYLELFEKVKYRNPNGCPIKATFFVSHEWTNYDAVQWLFQQGMEVASNSISSFPGLWEMPMNQFYGSYLPEIDSFRRSSMLRAAVDLNTTVEQLTNMLFSNFERSYLTNRAPYVLSLNADLLQLNGKNTGMEALQRFLEEVLYKKDVYVVTMRQLLHWMRNPVTLTRVSQQSASSHYPSISKTPCIKSNKCMYQTPGLPSQEHEFLTCSSCPNQYPWFDNTLGN
uniref:EB domain-containing protein n=1 Tax=Angiostrongylus cantonensis TaxID=6313 RepID=A0A0K0DQX5_ANGCA